MVVTINLRQMEAFRAVILSGSVSQASKQLYKSQPAVSMLINSLEENVGFQLFERRKKRLYPTPEAHYLYNEIESIFSRIQDVSQTVSDIKNKQFGFLRIGCMPGPSNFFMPDLVSDFLEEHPKIQISMQTRTSDGVKEWIASSQYDIGLAEVSSQENSFESESYNLNCLCALSVDHPLAGHKVITPELLDNEPMITLHPDHMTFHELQNIFSKHNSRMNVRLQTRFFIPALRFVERNLGVCVMDPLSIASYCSYSQAGKIVFRKFEPNINLKVSILYPADTPRSRITSAFAQLMRDRIESLIENPDQFTQW
ncbi:LysR family transcriptional regulator [Gammaproteobacteria bacterium AS21]